MTSKLIIVDSRIEKSALRTLEKMGDVALFETKNITYDAISCHPDIFIFQAGETIVLAPNIPEKYVLFLEKTKKKLVFGNHPIGEKYPLTAFYNAAWSKSLWIGNEKTVDDSIIELCGEMKFFNTNQGYSRCNTLIIDENIILTSDKTVSKVVPNAIWISPENIHLPGFKHGFFGGCCGFSDNILFVNGSFSEIENHATLRKLLEEKEIDVVELTNGKLRDIGGIFIESY